MYAKLKEYIAAYWLLIFFALIVIIVLLSGISLNEILATFGELSLWQIFLLVLVFFLATGVHIASRKYLLYALGANCSWKNLSFIHFSTLAAHYSTPVKIGIPVAIYLFKKIENVDYSRSTSMLLLEIAVGTSLCGLIALIGIPKVLGISLQQIVLFVALAGLAGILFIYVVSVLSARSRKRYKLIEFLRNTTESFRTLSPPRIAVYLTLSFLLRLVDGLNLFLLCVFFTEDLTLWQAVITTSTAFFVGTISMIPMGLGTRDVSILLLLQNYNISNDSAIVIVTLQRVLTTGLSFILGIFCGSVLGFKNVQDARLESGEEIKEAGRGKSGTGSAHEDI